MDPSEPPLNKPLTEKDDGEKPVVVGLYGLPGSGKSFLLKELRKYLSHADFDFYEGSEMIASLVPGGLREF
ncbi:KAP P-loop [Metarhizium album ARSEF 1941]|uniref:KAP P-loop n=1 Tax=Metarhizium album (strain ARSEF 1941) TaxID=1081103 RepID=A0A0B2WJN6_METAS|nr:KAP P-loop [Metarhizium album ARSEF 1941]KHN94158.1 KAP P-loop [Metarhizium album ARSEF 1941]